ncbi:hypothetical protein O181_098723 [Austropuccinia psidii MF-1]|uniref:Tet-like 2OG-Fe(II) oxygenase domain-containing protein n=1 Tax=Austropuccinia psidii MF-1 TaxID=1389203 RepID=A0A9Q3PEF9_9BASI|nr:hypothetical protein [Austropuccinia psidii MF-1]
MLPHLCGTLIEPHRRTLALVGSDCANVMWAPTGKSKDVCRRKLLGHWAPFWTQNSLASNGRKQYLISCLLQHIVIPQPLRNSGRSQKTNERKTTQMNRLFSSSHPTAQISMPVSGNITPSEIGRVVYFNHIKRIHFGCVEIFSSTGLLIALVKFQPFTTMSEIEVNQWDELSQFLFHKKRFTDPIATNGALLEGFMFAIGWCKCSTKNEQFGLYASVGKIENAKDEWQNQGANLSLVGCILGRSLRYVGDNLFEKIQNCYNSLEVPSFDQVNYAGHIPANQGACKFASALTFTMNGFKNSPHLDKDALLYASGWWFQADKRTGQIQRDASKWCTGGKLNFPSDHFCIDLSDCHGLIQVVWASSTFVHCTDPEQDNESTTLVGMSAQCSSRLAKTMWQKSHGYYEIGKRAGSQIRDGNTISCQLKE